MTVDLFWKEYNSPRNHQDFYAFCEEYQRLRFQEVTEATRKKHCASINKLKQFRQDLLYMQSPKVKIKNKIKQLQSQQQQHINLSSSNQC